VTASPAPSYSTASRPFLLASVWTLGLTWSPLLLTGVLGDTLAVGRFAAADRIAQVLPLMLVAVNAAVGPVVAPLFASGDVDAVRAVLRRCTMASAVAAAAVCGGLALGAPLLLSVFDAESATGALRVLLVGHFVVLACGPASVTLAMTGAELTLHRISAVALSAQIVLLLALVPRWGATGAAVASAFAWGGSRLVTALVARRPMLTPRVATPIGVP
jgi:O-antigen/teichoic acid export membrane protein